MGIIKTIIINDENINKQFAKKKLKSRAIMFQLVSDYKPAGGHLRE